MEKYQGFCPPAWQPAGRLHWMPFSGCIHMALPSGIASGAWLWRGQNSRLLSIYIYIYILIYYIFPYKFMLQRNIYIYIYVCVSPLKINEEYIYIYRELHVYTCMCVWGYYDGCFPRFLKPTIGRFLMGHNSNQ